MLGMNRRNGDYLSLYNSRRRYPLVDNKLLTKELAVKNGISVPKLLGVLEYPSQVKQVFNEKKITGPEGEIEIKRDFVLKPARGSGGEGIVVVAGSLKNGYRTVTGRSISTEQMSYHALGILSGMFSLGGHPDAAILETRVVPDRVFESVSYAGVPDIRIIVFLGFPIMAMVRLPTQASDGKANLHQGAVGAGVSIGSGRTVAAVLGNKAIEEHPDTGATVLDIEVPSWERLLQIAGGCYEMTGLGYLGVDIVLDVALGPQVLELNARPGLAIQIANQGGLLQRLRKVEAIVDAANPLRTRSAQDRLAVAIPLHDRLAQARENF